MTDHPSFQLGRTQLAMLLGFVVTLAGAALAVDALDAPYLTPRHKVGNQLVLHAYRTRPTTEDVLLLGSSRFDAGFDPPIVENQLRLALGRELSVYKVGLQGMRPWLLYQMLRDQVRERPPRELLVVGLEARYFFPTTEADVSSGTGLAYLGSWRDLVAVTPWALQQHELEAWRRVPFVGVQAMWNVDWLFLDDTRKRLAFLHQNGGKRLIDRQREDLVEATVAREAQRVRQEVDPTLLDPGQWRGPRSFTGLDMEGFERLLDLVPELPCRVVFVRPPVEATFDARKQAEEKRRFDELVVARLRERGLEYSDLARDPYPTDMASYRDEGSHLKRGGTFAASHALAVDLLAPRLGETGNR